MSNWTGAAYTAGGKRRSSQTHSRQGHTCELCGKVSFGNGGKVAHARGHVRRGELVELVKWYSTLESPSRIFLAPTETERIAALIARGHERLDAQP